jgi:hypothetical protein
VGIDPRDEHLIVTLANVSGPVAYALASGEEAWRFAGGVYPGLATCYDWAFSPDGRLMVVNGDRLGLYEATTRRPVPLPEPGAWRVDRLAFSGDGRLLASVTAGIATVRKL